MPDTTLRQIDIADQSVLEIAYAERGDGTYVPFVNPNIYDLVYSNITADTNVVSGQGEFGDIYVEAASTARLVIRDSTTTSGTVLFDHTWAAAFTGTISVLKGKRFSVGIHIDVTNTIRVAGEYRLR